MFNGEIYNHRRIRQELESRGARFRGHSDTEVLLAGIEHWGIEAVLRKCIGMFAIAVWDSARAELWLARDRVGEKPLYVWRTERGLAFASELTPVLLANDFRFETNAQALGLLLRYGYVPDSTCIVAGARKVRPGTVERWTVNDGVLSCAADVKRYWQIGIRHVTHSVDEQEACRLLAQELERCIGDQMVADVPVGSFLSGGIDSTIVTAVMQSLAPQPIRSFCVSFDDPQYDEGPYARRIAQHLGTEHTEVRIDKAELRNIVLDLPSIYDEPFADASQIPTVAVARVARSSVKVCLSGDGGDEVFGGYNRYYWPGRINRWFGSWPDGLRGRVASVLESFADGNWPTAARVMKAAVMPRGGPVQDFQGKLRKAAGILSARDSATAYLDLIHRCRNPRQLVPDWTGQDPGEQQLRTMLAGSDFFPAATQWDIENYLPGDNLVKVDRASMSVGLEMRAPLLDHRVLELGRYMVQGLPYRRFEREPKWPLRTLIRRFVPDEMMRRPKMGFSVPIAQWLRHDLRNWARELLCERLKESCGAIDSVAAAELLDQHLRGHADNSATLWPLLCYSAWIDGIRSRSCT